MKNKLLLLILFVITSVFIWSCEDFIAVDLSKKTITILAPSNNITLPTFTPLFKWDDVKGADNYQLQIVKPNFGAVAQFILDTSTSSTQFSCTLLPGVYQWRVRAKNNTSATNYVTYNLTIDSTLNLSGSTVGLISPFDNYYSKLMTNTFNWNTLPTANNYVFEILSSGSTTSIQSTTTTTANYTFTSEGIYQWRVYAQNSFSNSAYTTRTITIDVTAPAAPTPVFPVADTITANPISLKWNSASATDSSHLQISTDSTFAVISTKDTMIANVSNPTIYNFYSATISQYYFWRVQGIDKAGNVGVYFTRRRFKRL